MPALNWTKENNAFHLQGALEQTSLLSFWKANQQWDRDVKVIDVTNLTRVDSAGLALLVYYITHFGVKLQGMTANLLTLIKLYHLEKVVDPS